MAEIRPFRGVRYNQRLVDNLAAVICPPYDIITPPLQQELYHKSPYNFVRLEFSRALPQDTPADNKYTRSAATLKQWREQGIFEIDEMPALYLHDHYFTYQGKEYRRRGLTTCVRLEAPEKMTVRPHEGTLIEPKTDRLSLLWACQANTSPILALFEDEGRQISSLLVDSAQAKPVINLSGANGEGHKVWAITEPAVINQIHRYFSRQPLYIADGHHRYESAIMYQQERHAYSGGITGGEPFNFVMMTLVDFADPGLIILPPHRLVRGLSRATPEGLVTKLKALFDIEELPLNASDKWQSPDDSPPDEEVRVVLFGPAMERLLGLKPRDFATVSQMMPYFHSEIYKRLEVSVVDHVILEKVLGLSREQEETMLSYSYDKLEAMNRVLDQEYQLAFLLRPIRAEVVKAVADAGDKMPKKSTYFYPKAPAGLVFHRLV